jgi:signal transduction histidine kinase/GAF domain-containing protein
MSRMADSHEEDGSVEVADLDAVISTFELIRRPTRPPDHEAENRALVALVEAITASPDDILQNLVETALVLCRAHSAGISMIDGDRECFRWPAVAGQWSPYVGEGTRRDFGPCSTVLNRNAPLLFSRPERYFKYLAPVKPPVEEGLLIPFHVGGKPIGTIWVLAHDQTRKFDAEDLRVMTNLAHFAAAAYSTRTRQVAVRADVSSALGTAESLRGMLQSCAEALVRHLDAAVARIWVIAKDSGALELQTTAGIDTRLEGVHGPAGQSNIGLIAHERKPHITNDVRNDPRLNDQEWAPAEGMAAFAGYPLVVGSQAVGVMAMFSRKPISHVTTETLATIADAIAQGIQRAQSEADLRRSEAFLAEAQRLSSTGFFAWRLDTDEVTLSEELRRIYELDPNVAPTVEQLHGLVHPEDIPMMVEKRAQIRADHGPYEHEFRLRMPDDRVKYLHTFGHVIRRQDGRLESLGATQDVTQRRLAEEALDKARSELARVARVMSLGALTASIAHEVNQPLSGIITNASTCLRMLAADPPDLDGARETARRTIRDGNRASEVIGRLRALFSKKEATTELMDLNEATREVIALSLSELQGSRVVLRPELADDLPPITGDRVQLQQVILNLFRNASEAMSGVDDRPRQLVIRTERDEGDRVRLSVQDAGVGLEPQSLDRLFEAFYTTKSGGMGIGLSVSRSIIEGHNGRLWAAPNEGPGATFSFSIPREPANVTGAQSPRASRTPAAIVSGNVMRHH